ncbi:hypothetical protein [Chromobacterium haemolyticum]|uniref:hypothetical protein n=1 Tax=Chromobacterium haemolyticum TaxID=394935 RepID=UPI0011325FA8|nr:hypothetical protein [Chromobacterium haemolyticum]
MRFSKARPHQAEPATALDKKRNSNAAGCEGAIILKPFSIRTSAPLRGSFPYQPRPILDSFQKY